MDKVEKYFGYLNNTWIIQIHNTSPGYQYTSDAKNELISFTNKVALVIKEFCERNKVEVKNTGVNFFTLEDLELKLETAYISVTKELDLEFVKDIIKVVSLDGIRRN